jgi:hypothetical protein
MFPNKFLILHFSFIILLLATQVIAAPFTDNSDGTVKDNATGLIWQKCSQGQGATDCSGTATTTTWANAITYCSGLSSASKTWRLPTINELKTIVDTTKSSGATIDTTAFPATVAGSYWSSTTYAPGTTVAWYVSFGFGSVGNGGKALSVMCVVFPDRSLVLWGFA